MSTLTLEHPTESIALPPPVFPRGATLEEALRRRRSDQAFRDEALSLQTLASLLWAACGVNRRETGQRTAPSTRNWQEIDVFAVTAEGASRYDAAAHRLRPVTSRDLRGLTGVEAFVGSAPLNLVYVADSARMHECNAGDRSFFIGADAAVVAQNVSLYCAGAGLATVVRTLIDRRRLAPALRLRQPERIALAQSVGLPLQAR